jgi:predicted TIM-barrel fold metal-dependent hydrolase
MRFDMHCHVVGGGRDIDAADRDVYYLAEDNHHWLVRFLETMVEHELEDLGARVEGGRIRTRDYLKLVRRLLRRSTEIDAVVLLGLDAVYSPKTGERDDRRTDLLVSTRFLARATRALNAWLANHRKKAVRRKRFFCAPSVSPNRPDWEVALQEVIATPAAVAVKWIPSVLHVDPRDPRHGAFYDALAAAGLPLLCHVGPEYAFPDGIRNRALDGFRRLDRALDRGVRVIAAHCATPVLPLLDRDETRAFARFMEKANAGGEVRLWADTSALSLTTRIPYVRKIRDLIPDAWLLNGSDFPIPVGGSGHVPLVAPDMTVSEYLEIRRTPNPLDRDVRIKRAMGFPDSILENAANVLRLPASA